MDSAKSFLLRRHGSDASQNTHEFMLENTCVWRHLFADTARKQARRTLVTGAKKGPAPGTPAAKHGGNAVRAKYGVDFYAQIGKLGGDAIKQAKGVDFYAQIGHKGGESTKRNHGPEYYVEIGRKGGQRRSEDKKSTEG
jgi:general stress protein YciG